MRSPARLSRSTMPTPQHSKALDSTYGRDKSNVYVNGNPIPDADPATFQILHGANARGDRHHLLFHRPDCRRGSVVLPTARRAVRMRRRTRLLVGQDYRRRGYRAPSECRMPTSSARPTTGARTTAKPSSLRCRPAHVPARTGRQQLLRNVDSFRGIAVTTDTFIYGPGVPILGTTAITHTCAVLRSAECRTRPCRPG